eukprot:gene16638-18974_t
MIKNLLKVCTSNAPMSPRGIGRAVTPRSYSTETNEYVYNISVGNIAGVDPSVVDECPVCSSILREMHGDIAPIEMGNEVRVVGKIWLTPLAIDSDNDKYAMSSF